MTDLHYEVLVSDGVARNRSERLPDGSPIVSSPLASTLIFGEGDAVLVDPPFTRAQVQRVGDWVEHSGRRLAYISHGHGDHWFGTDLLMQRFPGAVAYATEGTIRLMHTQATEGRKQLWDADFPRLIPDSPVILVPDCQRAERLTDGRSFALSGGNFVNLLDVQIAVGVIRSSRPRLRGRRRWRAFGCRQAGQAG